VPTCFRLRPAVFFLVASSGEWLHERLIQVFIGRCWSSPLGVATGSSSASFDDVADHISEVDKSMSGFMGNFDEVVC